VRVTGRDVDANSSEEDSSDEDSPEEDSSDTDSPDAGSPDSVEHRDAGRLGGSLRVSDGRIVVDPAGTDPILVDPSTVSEVTHRSIAWFQLLMGVGIVAFGLLSVSRHLLGAFAFVLAGAAVLLVTWRRRDRVRIHVHGRAKPLSVYPEEPEAFLSAVEEALEEASPAEEPSGDSPPAETRSPEEL
jgi:hypothetical protein